MGAADTCTVEARRLHLDHQEEEEEGVDPAHEDKEEGTHWHPVEDIDGGGRTAEAVRGGKLWLGCMDLLASATVLGVAGMGEFP